MSIGTAVVVFAAVYLAICFGLSMYAAKKSTETSQKDFYVAGGSLGTFVLFLTSLATAFSAFAFQGQLGQTYNIGISAIFNFFGYGILSYPLFLLLGSKLWYFGKRYGYITPADFIADRYESNKSARVLIGLIIGIYFSIFYIVIQIKACSWVLLEATGMSTPLATLIIAAILAFYVAKGGMRAVAYVDVVQAVFLLIGSAVIVGSMIYYNGGVEHLFSKAMAVRPDTFAPKGNMVATMSSGMVMWLSMPLWPVLWTKYYCAKNISTLHGVATGSGLGTVIVTVSFPLFIVAGLAIAFPNASAAEADNLVIRYILNYTNPIVASCVVGGLLSAAMSTAGGLLLLISSIITQDLPKILSDDKRKNISEEKLVRFGKIMVFVVLIVSYGISLLPLGQLVAVGTQLAYPGYLLAIPAVIGGLWWKRGNGQGMTWSLIVGLVIVYITTYVVRNPLNLHSGIWGLLAATITYIGVSLSTEPNSQAALGRFGLADGQWEDGNSMSALDYAKKCSEKGDE